MNIKRTDKQDIILTCLSSRPKPALLIICSCDDSATANNFESTLAAPTCIVCRKYLIFRHVIGQSIGIWMKSILDYGSKISVM